jgi:hypothetical protein
VYLQINVSGSAYGAGMQPPYRVTTTEWEVVYPAHVEPIGRIRREKRSYTAVCGQEDLGAFDSGDEAVEAIWRRFVEQSNAQHEEASRVHGGYGRHTRNRSSPQAG